MQLDLCFLFLSTDANRYTSRTDTVRHIIFYYDMLYFLSFVCDIRSVYLFMKREIRQAMIRRYCKLNINEDNIDSVFKNINTHYIYNAHGHA